MNKLFCGIDLPLSTIFQSVPGSLLHPGTQTDAEMTNKQTNKQILKNTDHGHCWKNIISFSGDKENKFKKLIFCLHSITSLAGWGKFRDNRLKRGSFYDGYSKNSCLHLFSSQFLLIIFIF